MAFGIDDVLATAASGINLCDTLVRIVKSNAKNSKSLEVEALLFEVRAEAVKKINEAQIALNEFERTLTDRGIPLDNSLRDIIRETSFWRPYERFKLSQIKRDLDHFGDCVFRSSDDIAALMRCVGDVEKTGLAVIESSEAKHEFNQRLLYSQSVSETLEILRNKLTEQKTTLTI